jgi:hypothetical protein
MKKPKIQSLCLFSISMCLPCFAQIQTITAPIKTDFATYVPNSVPFVPNAALYAVPDKLTGVLFADQYRFSDSAMTKLLANGFVCVMTNERNIPSIYSSTANRGLPVFVATDALLQSFHIVYDKMLRIAEHERFFFQLDTMLAAMMQASVALQSPVNPDSLQTALVRTQALLDVAHTLLTDSQTLSSDTAVSAMVKGELTLIGNHAGMALSKVVPEIQEDYSQYVPRGHYTLDDRLARYFKSMMYLGRMNLRVSSSMETVQACILSRLLTTAASNASALWDDIYSTTSFFAGRSDDLNYRDYDSVISGVLGYAWKTGTLGALYAKRDSIRKALDKLPPPMILSGNPSSSIKGFRVMGQRFEPDSYVFSKIVDPYVASRSFPKGLDILACLGSARAKQLLFDYYHDNKLSGYTSCLDTMTKLFVSLPPSQWAENLYWNWLYSLVPLLGPTTTGYPFFMSSQAWADKSLTTAAGSWAELRHDAILYAKQSYGTVGVCSPTAASTQGYVEPCPEVYGRLAALSLFMHNGLAGRGLSTILPIQKLTVLDSTCLRLRTIAVKELTGGNITSDEYYTISMIGKTLSGIENFAAYQIPPPTYPNPPPAPDSSMAVVADVHTNLELGKVLEVGVGCPMYLYVVVPVEGRLQLCAGAIMSYYEFSQPMSNRLTDQQWQKMLADSTAPAMPAWTSSYVSGSIKIYPNNALDETSLFSAAMTVADTFHAGDSVVANIGSDDVPWVTVEWGTNSSTVFAGVLETGRTYRITIPPEALADSLVTATFSSSFFYRGGDLSCSKQIPLTYRKLLHRKGTASAMTLKKSGELSYHPRISKDRIVFPPNSSWRIVTVQGRLLAKVTGGLTDWVVPKRLANTPLILVPTDRRFKKPVRLIIAN